MREILLCYALSYSSNANGLATCMFASVCISVYILSPSLSFNVQITYECYEVLKSKNLYNMVTFGKCLEYIWKGFVRDAENPLPREFIFEIFHDAIRIGGRMLVWRVLTIDRLLTRKGPIWTIFIGMSRWKIATIE